jgi:alkylation response protein AidB-like acyl-CoA dehydrogenase
VDFTLSPEESDILDLVRDFATGEVLPRAAEIDEKAEYPADLVAKMAELGLMGMPFPEEYGGAAQSYVTFALMVEEICRACASTGLIVDVNISLCGEPILMFGTEEQKRRYLTPLATG